ncbi:ribonuclease [Paenibacillus bovis]|uniref:Ribonuclease n=1 Tax=Paenibacillus bovis TaxID=1616788 RepID=A0A172ZFG5_9BACL|nr:ribonuclease [Paenibacillus bovis]
MSKKLSSIIVLVIAAVLLLFGAGDRLGLHLTGENSQQSAPTAQKSGDRSESASTPAASSDQAGCQIINTFDGVADYLREHGELPCNYITKKEAEQLGWDAGKGNLNKVAPGKSIGGDTFSNREGLLPRASGRKWHEADINYTSGFRGADRILYSTDGLIYKTTNHYKSFQQMK